MCRSATARTALRMVFLSLAVALTASAQQAFYGNIIHNNGLGTCTAAAPCNCASFFNPPAGSNDAVDPLLTDPFDPTNPDWMPLLASPALAANDNVSGVVFPVDGCTDALCEQKGELQFQYVCYRGALSPAEGDWTQGWTYYNYDGAGRTDIDYGKPLVILSGSITVNTALTNANNYLLRGRVAMESGTVLTIEPGTVIFGENATEGFLVIERGAQIYAVGTPDAPIVMTTDLPPGSMSRGGWGGLVIHGRAIANCADCIGGQSCASEGGTAGFFCGGDDCDGSGELRYVRVEYAGIVIVADNELNAFTFNGLGTGTKLSYLQAHMGDDDNFEWFGGKVFAHHIVSTGGGDDGFDWQMGFRGYIQFAIDQHYDDAGDKGIEADNNEFDLDAPCRSHPTCANLTLIGPGIDALFTTSGINLRRGTDASIFNSIIMGWPQYGLNVQNAQTCARGFVADPGAACGPAIAVEDASRPAAIALRAYPNPVVHRASFVVDLAQAGHTNLSVFDVRGRLVDTVVDQELGEGSHSFDWVVPADLAGGVYYYRVAAAGHEARGRFFRLR